MKSIECFVFDLDNTLYPKETGLLQSVGVNISKFIAEKLGFNDEEADLLRQKYKEKYGITLSGLIKHHGINPKDFDEFVYNLEYDEKLEKDDKLIAVLKKIDKKKIIYTNSGKIHSQKVLKKLEIEHLFDEIITIEKLDFFAKPTKKSFEYFIEQTSIKPGNSIFFEDSEINLTAAKNMGFKTVLIGNENPDFDICLKQIADIIEIFEFFK